MGIWPNRPAGSVEVGSFKLEAEDEAGFGFGMVFQLPASWLAAGGTLAKRMRESDIFTKKKKK